jgi:hypothetical protein
MYQREQVTQRNVDSLVDWFESHCGDSAVLDTFRGLVSLWRGDAIARDDAADIKGVLQNALSAAQAAESAWWAACDDIRDAIKDLDRRAARIARQQAQREAAKERRDATTTASVRQLAEDLARKAFPSPEGPDAPS